MTKAELKQLSNEELITHFYWLGVRTTKEVNTKRGLSKKTEKEESLVVDELCERFNLDKEVLIGRINR